MDTPTSTPIPSTEDCETPRAKADPVMEGLRQELLQLMQGELTAANLHLVIQTAQLARDMLALRNPRLRRRVRPRKYMGGGDYPYEEEDDDPTGMEPVPVGSVSFGPNPGGMDRETFGAKVLRELVAVLPEISRVQREDPAQLVRALAEARSAGLEDVAAELHARLTGRPVPPRTIPVQPTFAGEAQDER